MAGVSLIKKRVKQWVFSSPFLHSGWMRFRKFQADLPFYFKKRNWFHKMLFCGKCSKEDRFFKKILENEKINVVLDVGAHAGETGWALRDWAQYKGRIVSFEPLEERFGTLQKRAELDPPWECHKIALGKENETKKLNIFNNLYTSSFLSPEDCLKKECNLQKKKEEAVAVRRLEDLYPSLCKPEDLVLLKMDTQGFEKQILEGAGKFLFHLKLIKLEVSCVPLYSGETLIGDMILFLDSLGFSLILIMPGHVSEKGHHLQADLLFLNRNQTSSSHGG